MSATDFYKRNGCFKRCPGGFSVQAARNYNHRHDGPTDYAKCVRKYKIGGTAHTPFVYNHQRGCVCRRKKRSPVDFSTGPNTQGNIRIAAEISELHEVNQDPDDGMTMVPSQDIQNDTEYACPVTIGTPGETLTLDFDTGSADLWVWSSQARVSKADMKGRGIYDPKKSRTSKRLRGHTWEVRYGDGSSASGVVYMDTIVIGDITVENQAVEVARELSDDFLQAGCDGLVGLGKYQVPRLNQVRPNRQKTPMENMVEQGVIKDPIFTVKLDKRDSRGFYTFGFIDETVHCSKFYWQDVDKENGWWEVPSAYIKIGDQIYNRGQENTAIIDTGTTLVLLDDETVERLYSKIEGAAYDEDQGGYIFPTKSDIPHLAFCVGRWLFTMPGYELSFSEMGNGMSYGAVQSRGQNRQDILGDVWLKHVYVVFEQSEKPRVGVAQRS